MKAKPNVPVIVKLFDDFYMTSKFYENLGLRPMIVYKGFMVEVVDDWPLKRILIYDIYRKKRKWKRWKRWKHAEQFSYNYLGMSRHEACLKIKDLVNRFDLKI